MKCGYFRESTIAAIATATGGAISIVRVSGPRARSILDQVTRSDVSCHLTPGKLTRARLSLPNGSALDNALFAAFIAPQSYTGEDLIEFHLHGGSFIAQRMMETLVHFGAEQALAGEFSFRAVRNGKMSLFQAQAVADLIESKNDTAISVAIEKLSGVHFSKLNTLATGLRELSALGEIGIDFSDQDLEELSLPSLKKRVQTFLLVLRDLEESFQRGIRIQEGIRVAFVGLPNAGKSSFFNTLLGEDRSIVSDEPGTTRDVVREQITLRAPGSLPGSNDSMVTLRLKDTAGLRLTQNAVEKMGIDRTIQSVKAADLVLFLVDPFSPIEAVEKQWSEICGSIPSDRVLGILTKCDLLDSQGVLKAQDEVGRLGIPVWIPTSSTLNQGISEAIRAIVSKADQWLNKKSGETLLTRLDHLNAVRAGSESLQRALEAPEIDLFASDIRHALVSLSPVIGETAPDDILEKIFSDFCVGK